MRIHLTEHGPTGDEGEQYEFETDLDVGTPDEAYVKGREWARLCRGFVKGVYDEYAELNRAEEAVEAEAEGDDDDP